jgi:hypothetical protein
MPRRYSLCLWLGPEAQNPTQGRYRDVVGMGKMSKNGNQVYLHGERYTVLQASDREEEVFFPNSTHQNSARCFIVHARR